MYCMGSLTFASLSVCVFVRSSVSVCLFVSECMSVFLSVCLSVCLSVSLSVSQFVFLPGCLSVFLCAFVLTVCLFVCVPLCVCVCDGHAFPPNPKAPYHPKGGLIGGLGFVRLPLDAPQPGNRIRFVRACGRGEAACLRERDSISVAGLKILKFSSGSGSSSSGANRTLIFTWDF